MDPEVSMVNDPLSHAQLVVAYGRPGAVRSITPTAPIVTSKAALAQAAILGVGFR